MNSIRPDEESEAMADLLDLEGPQIVNDLNIPYDLIENHGSKKIVQKVDIFTNNKWVKVDLCENDDGDLYLDNNEHKDTKSMFRKRGEKAAKRQQSDERKDSDSDFDLAPRRRKEPSGRDEENDSDLDSVPRRRPNQISNNTNEDDDSDLDRVPRRNQPDRRNSDDDLSTSIKLHFQYY